MAVSRCFKDFQFVAPNLETIQLNVTCSNGLKPPTSTVCFLGGIQSYRSSGGVFGSLKPRFVMICRMVRKKGILDLY